MRLGPLRSASFWCCQRSREHALIDMYSETQTTIPMLDYSRKSSKWMTGRTSQVLSYEITGNVRIVPRVTPNCSWTRALRTTSAAPISPAVSAA